MSTDPVRNVFESPRASLDDDRSAGSQDAAVLDELAGEGFGIRAAAQIIDMFYGMAISMFGGVFAGVVLVVMQTMGSIEAGWEQRVEGFSIGATALSMVASILYHTFCEGIHGSSFGKMCLGLRVVRTDGRKAGLWAGFIRSLAFLIDAMFFGLIAYYAMQNNPRNQRHGDSWADTMVVKSKAVPASLRPGTGTLLFGLFVGSAVLGVINTAAIIMRGM